MTSNGNPPNGRCPVSRVGAVAQKPLPEQVQLLERFATDKNLPKYEVGYYISVWSTVKSDKICT
ncbi:hypothetical protein [Maribacter sp. 2-571]|uniref:hypothetical protein n=1 Tax=Maribacter sp. 2-571 TaxID=3417569 RepID=UPI003D3256BB